MTDPEVLTVYGDDDHDLPQHTATSTCPRCLAERRAHQKTKAKTRHQQFRERTTS